MKTSIVAVVAASLFLVAALVGLGSGRGSVPGAPEMIVLSAPSASVTSSPSLQAVPVAPSPTAASPSGLPPVVAVGRTVQLWKQPFEVVHGGNPYVDHPSSYPDDPALGKMGARWRDKTSVYGPAFTLASEGVAHAAGSSAGAAAWAYKVIAALAALASAGLAASLAQRRALAAAFVGWNPILAVHMAGGGHNDAWLGLLVLGAITLAALRSAALAGISWALAVTVKWVPLVFLALQLLEARARRRRVGLAGMIAAAAAVSALASWRYGWRWLTALAPLSAYAQQAPPSRDTASLSTLQRAAREHDPRLRQIELLSAQSRDPAIQL